MRINPKKTLVIIITTLVVFSVIIVIVAAINSNKTPDDQISIKNFDQLVKNLSNKDKEEIFRSLAIIVAHNNPQGTPDIGDAVIRTGSEYQKKDSTVYVGSFIIDIESIRQSYKIDYRLLSTNNQSKFAYPVTASCLKESELIYGKFDCKDPNQTSRSDPNNILEQKLPYQSPYYRILQRGDDGIVIQISLNYSEDTIKFFKIYRQEALKWLGSQGIDVNKFSVEYRDTLNNPVNI